MPGPIIYRAGKAMHAAGMDVNEVRKRNLAMLAERAGGPTNFARQVSREQPQVSQWLSGKPVGSKLARDLELRLGLERGWLDRPQSLPKRY